MFDQPLGLVQDHFGHLNVSVGGFVEGGGDHLTVDGALHIGHLFGALIDKQDQQRELRSGCDVIGVCEALQQHGLTSTGRRHDQAALAFAERSEQVHHTRRQVAFESLGFELEPLILGIERCQTVEVDPFASGLSGESKLTASTRTRAKYCSPSLGGLI